MITLTDLACKKVKESLKKRNKGVLSFIQWARSYCSRSYFRGK
jgi:hypothetical protein